MLEIELSWNSILVFLRKTFSLKKTIEIDFSDQFENIIVLRLNLSTHEYTYIYMAHVGSLPHKR